MHDDREDEGWVTCLLCARTMKVEAVATSSREPSVRSVGAITYGNEGERDSRPTPVVRRAA
jgi:hypothetical protein